ncbi:MAG: hypothetical protein SFU99_15205 [Saprospiraceae bacterium]|nr:hypothetical protein [Saprospiraceae bacterium]
MRFGGVTPLGFNKMECLFCYNYIAPLGLWVNKDLKLDNLFNQKLHPKTRRVDLIIANAMAGWGEP